MESMDNDNMSIEHTYVTYLSMSYHTHDGNI